MNAEYRSPEGKVEQVDSLRTLERVLAGVVEIIHHTGGSWDTWELVYHDGTSGRLRTHYRSTWHDWMRRRAEELEG